MGKNNKMKKIKIAGCGRCCIDSTEDMLTPYDVDGRSTAIELGDSVGGQSLSAIMASKLVSKNEVDAYFYTALGGAADEEFLKEIVLTLGKVPEDFECENSASAHVLKDVRKIVNGYFMNNESFIDDYGHKLLKQCKKYDLNMQYSVVPGGKTPHSVVQIDGDKRAIVRKIGPHDKTLNISDELEVRNDYDAIEIDGSYSDFAIKLLKNNPNAIRMLDSGRDSKEELILTLYANENKLVDYIVASFEFANYALDCYYCDSLWEKLPLEEKTKIGSFENYYKEYVKSSFAKTHRIISFKPENIENNIEEAKQNAEMMKVLRSLFGNVNFAVTIGSGGCLYFNEDNKLNHLGAFTVPERKFNKINTNSAGDTYHGLLLYALTKKYSLDDAFKFASIGVGMAIDTDKLSAKFNTPNYKEILDYLNCSDTYESIDLGDTIFWCNSKKLVDVKQNQLIKES